MVEGILGHPQIAEPERVGALGNLAHRRNVDRVRSPMRQREAE